MVHAPIVLHIGGPRDVIPLTAVLDGQFVVARSGAQQEISKVISGEVVVERERTLCVTKQVLNLFVEGPTPTHLELVCALGPGKVIADLIIDRLVVPWPTRVRVVRIVETRKM